MVFISSQKKTPNVPSQKVAKTVCLSPHRQACHESWLLAISTERHQRPVSIQPGRMAFWKNLELKPRWATELFFAMEFVKKGTDQRMMLWGKCVVFPGGGFSKYLFFPPRSLGKWSNLTVACVSGWNHQHAPVSSCFDVIQDFFPLEDDRHNLFQANEVG